MAGPSRAPERLTRWALRAATSPQFETDFPTLGDASTEAVTCFDTAEAHLARWGVGLERRGTAWWLDLPTDKASGRELALAAEHHRQVPAEITRGLRDLTGGAPLVPVARLEIHRRKRATAGGVLDDDGITRLEGRRVAQRMRVLQSPPEGPDEAALVAIGAVPVPGPLTHVLLGPPLPFHPFLAPPAVGPGAPAADVIGAHLARHTRALLLQQVRLRWDLPDAVHQVRVAARRLRSGLRTFLPLMDHPTATHLQDELAWLADQVGAFRDTEVLLARMRESVEDLPPAFREAASTAVVGALEQILPRERARAVDCLDEPRHRDLLDALRAASARPPCTADAAKSGEDVLPPLLAAAWRRLEKSARALGEHAPPEAWHRTRIRAKRVRYAAEALEPVLGRAARRRAKHVSTLTELLGEYQDAEVAAGRVLDLATHAATAHTATALGLLAGLELGRQRAVRARFAEAWATVARGWRG